MKLREIIDTLERLAPLPLRNEGDNSGLQVGFPDADIHSILVCLDVTEAIVDEAIAQQCNMIVSHHPLLYRPLSCISDGTYQQRCVVGALAAGIAIYSGEFDKKKTLKKVLTHPCVIACILGLLAMALSIPIPALLQTPIQSIGRCNTPLTMMMIGMILSEIDLKRLVDKTILRFTVHRLVLMPLVVYLACLALPVSKMVTGVSVLLAAMPAGATTTMLSAKYDRDPEFATKLVVFTTLCSVPAIFLWSMVLI